MLEVPTGHFRQPTSRNTDTTSEGAGREGKVSEYADKFDHGGIGGIYDESSWHVNTGGQTIHAKRMPGRFRRLKWLTHSLWLLFFIGPYLRWNGQQAVLFDIPDRQFHIFDITVMPQDIWMLSLLLLLAAITLFAVTAIAGRVFCGYFCFQTAWTDVYTWIEEKLEGQPHKRRKLDQAPMSFKKLRIKAAKHAIWLAIAMLTGLSFAAWFTDAYQLWVDYFTLNAHPAAWITLGMFTAGTYLLAGFMREQVCFWLCPYARIQGVMYDAETILPTYDYTRGEPRGKLKKGEAAKSQGDCIDCNQCVAVCPTGIDIREGQQEGCITCALCIDACDSVMDKVDRPRGLIRYASLDEIEGKPTKKLFQRPRVLVYFTIISIALAGIGYGLTHLGSVELKALHQRQPLFVRQSDGSIQNGYEIKILNKTDKPMNFVLRVSGMDEMTLVGAEEPLPAEEGHVTAYTVFVRVEPDAIKQRVTPIQFRVVNPDNAKINATYESMFVAPR